MLIKSIKSKLVDGKRYPLVIANKNGEIKCPFCGSAHKHGVGGGNGHRISHCSGFFYNPIHLEDGAQCYKTDGYYISIEKN